jgi:hypothetical protein
MKLEHAMTSASPRAVEAATHAKEPAATQRPSLLRYSPALVLLAIVIADAFQLADPDLWAHLRFGQMLLAGDARHLDPFNYSAPGHTWLHYTWLFEVVMAWLYAHLGVIGLKLLKFGCSAALVTFVALALAETGAELAAQIAVLLLTAIALTLGMQFRPQMFDFTFVSAIVWLLARDNYRRSAPLWVTIPMFVLWSNLHPGFFVGLAAMGVYSVVSAFNDLQAGRGIAHGIRLGVIVMLGTAATLANPLAFESWKSIIVTLRDPLIPQVMADCRSLLTRLTTTHFPSLISLYSGYALALICALAILFAIVPAAGDLPLVAVAALMSAAAFDAERNISFAVIAIAPPLARRIAILAGRRTARVADTAASPTRRSPANEAIVIAVAVLLALDTGLFSPKLRDAVWPPSGAVAFMDAHGLHGNILNEFTWGEYLIWHMAPQSHIFIDGRFDLVYPQSVIRDYTNFRFGAPEAARVLVSYPHDFVLIEPDSEAFKFMAAQADWKLIYDDRHCALFARADSAAATIAGTPVHGESGGNEFP